MDDRDRLCSEGSSDSEESLNFEVIASLESLLNTFNNCRKIPACSSLIMQVNDMSCVFRDAKKIMKNKKKICLVAKTDRRWLSSKHFSINSKYICLTSLISRKMNHSFYVFSLSAHTFCTIFLLFNFFKSVN